MITTIYAGFADNVVYSQDSYWLGARAGSGLKYVGTATDTLDTAGCRPSYYQVRELCFPFTTSSLSGQIPVAATFSLRSNGVTGTGWNWQARGVDCGAAVDTGDFVAGADWDGKPLCASIATSDIVTGYNALTSTDALLTHINTTGTTWLVLGCDAIIQTSGWPSEILWEVYMADNSGTTADPKLVIDSRTAYDPIWFGTNM